MDSTPRSQRVPKKIDEQLQSQLNSELEKERWKEEALYKENTKPQLDVMCRQLGVPVTPALLKHRLSSLIYQKQNKEPPLSCTILYSGNILSVPHTISGIGRLTVAKLKAILRTHKLPYLGSKDELVRVFMLRQDRRSEASLKERNAMVDLINVAKDLIMAEQLMNLTNHIYRTRKYATYTSKTFVPMPSHIRGEQDLLNLYIVHYRIIYWDFHVLIVPRKSLSNFQRVLILLKNLYSRSK